MTDKNDILFNITVNHFMGIPLFKTKTYQNYKIIYLFGFIPVYKKNIPYVNDNTFIVWEPCSVNHGEIVPGYVKYLSDLGYSVSVIVNPKHIKGGLFSRFEDKNIFLNKISRNEAKKFFKKNDINKIKGILVTTAGKLCDNINFNQCFEHFHPDFNKSKLYLVQHDAKPAIDRNKWQDNIITLRELNYKNTTSTVINPHYFGAIKITPKNDITNFVMIGRLSSRKGKSSIILNSIEKLIEKGYTNFKLTVIGKGNLRDIPPAIKKYLDIKGRLSFDKMYDEIEKADFILTSYDRTNPNHIFYNTTGTSGNFQLVYGFLKPIIILNDFAQINGFNDTNSILYNNDNNYSDAMIKAINLSKQDYQNMQNNLKIYADNLYETSLNNLRNLIDKQS